MGLAAASTPQALAADVGTDVPLPVVPDAAELAGAILEEAGAPALPAAVADPPSSDLPAAPAQPAAAEPVQTGAGAAPPPEPDVEPVAEEAPQAPVAAPQPDPPVLQVDPTNVNVSIRVDSPGDDGAVTQGNVAVQGVPPQYQPEPPQYQPVVPPAESAGPDTRPSEPLQGSTAAVADGSWDWTWNWGCGDAPIGDVAIPSGVATQNWNWNWTWNCGSDEPLRSDSREEYPPGYQAPPKQYRPVNINVAIRINSPGDNGPVVQANVAVGVTVPTASLPPLPVALQPPVPAASPSLEAPPAPAPQSAQAEGEPGSSIGAAPVAAREEEDGCCLVREPRGVAVPADASTSVVVAATRLATARDTTPAAADIAVVARLERRARHVETAASAPSRPQARPARPASTRSFDPDGSTVVVQGGVELVPLGGPDRLLPYVVLLLISFLFAFANASWASTGSRPTPGVDADDPPTRPG